MKDLINKNHYRIQTIIKKITGNYNEDIEQEVYIKTIKNIDKYQERNKFGQWISTIAANCSRDYLKSSFFKNANNTIALDDQTCDVIENKTPEKIYSQKERQKIILRTIDSLNPKLRKVIILYEFEDYSYEDISKKLNIPIGTTKSRINSARKILREKLQFLIGDE